MTYLKELHVLGHLWVMAHVLLGEQLKPFEDFALHQSESALTNRGRVIKALEDRLKIDLLIYFSSKKTSATRCKHGKNIAIK